MSEKGGAVVAQSSGAVIIEPIPWIGFDSKQDTRVAKAVRMIHDILASGYWHSRKTVITQVVSETGLLPKTVANLFRGMVQTGTIQQRGGPREREVAGIHCASDGSKVAQS